MKIVADLHVHTVASRHAYGTLNEMVGAAADKGLSAVGLADHGPAMPDGGAHQYYFNNLTSLPRKLYGITILRGAEANVIDRDGNIDIWPEVQGQLDYLIASMHNRGVSCEGLSLEENTQIFVRAMRHPAVKIMGHPENPAFPLVPSEFVAGARQYGKIIEVNNASFSIRQDGLPILEEIVKEAVKQRVSLIVSSDAHFVDRVGVFDDALALLDKLKVSEELVVNSSMERLEEALGISG